MSVENDEVFHTDNPKKDRHLYGIVYNEGWLCLQSWILDRWDFLTTTDPNILYEFRISWAVWYGKVSFSSLSNRKDKTASYTAVCGGKLSKRNMSSSTFIQWKLQNETDKQHIG